MKINEFLGFKFDPYRARNEEVARLNKLWVKIKEYAAEKSCSYLMAIEELSLVRRPHCGAKKE